MYQVNLFKRLILETYSVFDVILVLTRLEYEYAAGAGELPPCPCLESSCSIFLSTLFKISLEYFLT